MSNVEKYPLASQSVDNLRSDPELAVEGVPHGLAFAPGAFNDSGSFRIPVDVVGNMTGFQIIQMLRPFAIRYGVMFKVEYDMIDNVWLVTWRPDETTPRKEIDHGNS